jgi:hypothetical protein
MPHYLGMLRTRQRCIPAVHVLASMKAFPVMQERLIAGNGAGPHRSQHGAGDDEPSQNAL